MKVDKEHRINTTKAEKVFASDLYLTFALNPKYLDNFIFEIKSGVKPLSDALDVLYNFTREPVFIPLSMSNNGAPGISLSKKHHFLLYTCSKIVKELKISLSDYCENVHMLAQYVLLLFQIKFFCDETDLFVDPVVFYHRWKLYQSLKIPQLTESDKEESIKFLGTLLSDILFDPNENQFFCLQLSYELVIYFMKKNSSRDAETWLDICIAILDKHPEFSDRFGNQKKNLYHMYHEIKEPEGEALIDTLSSDNGSNFDIPKLLTFLKDNRKDETLIFLEKRAIELEDDFALFCLKTINTSYISDSASFFLEIAQDIEKLMINPLNVEKLKSLFMERKWPTDVLNALTYLQSKYSIFIQDYPSWMDSLNLLDLIPLFNNKFPVIKLLCARAHFSLNNFEASVQKYFDLVNNGPQLTNFAVSEPLSQEIMFCKILYMLKFSVVDDKECLSSFKSLISILNNPEFLKLSNRLQIFQAVFNLLLNLKSTNISNFLLNELVDIKFKELLFFVQFYFLFTTESKIDISTDDWAPFYALSDDSLLAGLDMLFLSVGHEFIISLTEVLVLSLTKSMRKNLKYIFNGAKKFNVPRKIIAKENFILRFLAVSIVYKIRRKLFVESEVDLAYLITTFESFTPENCLRFVSFQIFKILEDYNSSKKEDFEILAKKAFSLCVQAKQYCRALIFSQLTSSLTDDALGIVPLVILTSDELNEAEYLWELIILEYLIYECRVRNKIGLEKKLKTILTTKKHPDHLMSEFFQKLLYL